MRKVLTAAALLAVFGGLSTTAGSAAAATACSPVANVEAIVDDSGSMSVTDTDKLRVQALNLLIDTPGNEKVTLGVVEFGSDADTVFGPALIGTYGGLMKAALTQKINADNGGTDYNAAFAKAAADNPNAGARIFLTDGGHNAGTYNNGHRGGPPTYVIGFSSSITGDDLTRLRTIASETGGRFYQVLKPADLQTAMNDIGTRLTCQSPPVLFRDSFFRAGTTKPHTVALTSSARSVQLVANWQSPLDQFDIIIQRIVLGRRTVAVSRVRHMHIVRRRGTTFQIVKLTNVTRGKLKFTIKARKIRSLSSSQPKVSLTTQVSQSRRR